MMFSYQESLLSRLRMHWDHEPVVARPRRRPRSLRIFEDEGRGRRRGRSGWFMETTIGLQRRNYRRSYLPGPTPLALAAYIFGLALFGTRASEPETPAFKYFRSDAGQATG